MDRKIFFNSSLPRSGSTLLQNIMAQNPRIYSSPTSHVLVMILAVREKFSTMREMQAIDPELMKKGYLSFCRAALYGFYDGITDKPVCVDKSRGWYHYYDMLAEMMPRPKMLVCVRDLRAILSSMEKIWRKNNYRADPHDDVSKMNMVTIPHRVTHWLNNPPVGLSIMLLLDAIQTGRVEHFHIVRFEDLTTNPARVMQGVYDYLEEPYYEHDFENIEQVTQEDDALYGMYGDHTIRQQVRPVPDDYNEVLGQDVARNVRLANQLFYETFYPLAM